MPQLQGPAGRRGGRGLAVGSGHRRGSDPEGDRMAAAGPGVPVLRDGHVRRAAARRAPGLGVLRGGAERRRGGTDRVRERAARACRAGDGHAAGGAGLAGLGGQGQCPAGGAAGQGRVRCCDARGAGRPGRAGRGRDPGERAGQERPAARCTGRRRRRTGPRRQGEGGCGCPARADRPDPGRAADLAAGPGLAAQGRCRRGHPGRVHRAADDRRLYRLPASSHPAAPASSSAAST